MRLEVTPFQPFHLELLRAQGVQGSQSRVLSHVPAGYASVHKLPGPAMTAFDGERVILCGGICTIGPKMGVLWALLSARAGNRMLSLHRCVSRFLQTEPLRRLEASVEKGFAPGCRWLDLLGFKYEGDMLAYGDDGETHERWARVN